MMNLLINEFILYPPFLTVKVYNQILDVWIESYTVAIRQPLTLRAMLDKGYIKRDYS
jgi:hypothetical protein